MAAESHFDGGSQCFISRLAKPFEVIKNSLRHFDKKLLSTLCSRHKLPSLKKHYRACHFVSR